MKEENYLHALDLVLSCRIPQHSYCIGGRSDGAICIEKCEHKWIVYYYNRNFVNNVGFYPTALEACIGVLKQIAEDNDELKVLEDDFILNIRR